jgi:ABC-type glycerol-3-phosphate transport system substrate-binding protein
MHIGTINNGTGNHAKHPGNEQRTKAMKKIILATAAVAALAAGVSSAQAKVNVDLYLGGFGGHHGYYAPVDYGYNNYEPDCHYVKVKKVKWVNGYKVVTFKKKLVCDSY